MRRCLFALLCLQLQLQSSAYSYYRQKSRNNVCKNFKDYKYIDTSPNCWYNPDVDATVPEMITRNNYPVERYQVATADGYILTIFRIPKKESNKGVVYLQHPLTAAAHVWVDKGNKSLAFLLSNAGYDIWMGNFRGTIYSNKHLRLSTASNAYWNHSFHEMGIYDLPAQIDLVKKYSHTNDKIYYVGHSMGTTAAFVYNALLPKHAKKNIKVFVEMAPTAFIGNSNVIFKHVAFLREPIVNMCEQLNYMNLLSHNGIVHNFAKGFCFYKDNLERCSKLIIFLGMGPNYGNEMPEWFPLMMNQNFAGFSIKILSHYWQHTETDKFNFYNYGNKRNIIAYGTEIAPDYPIENIVVPHYLIHGGNDWISTPKDVQRLYDLLPKEAKKYGKYFVESHNHYDAMYGKNCKETVYDHILHLFNNVIK